MVEKEFKRKFGFEAGVEASKKKIFKELVDAIQDGDSKRSIHRLVRAGEFTEEELEEAYKQARE